jgi:Fe-Mn family superoxide dismutase
MKKYSMPLLLTLIFASSLGFAQEKSKDATVEIQVAKVGYEPKDFSKLIGMQGFSDNALNMHFTLYKGYVKNTNLLLDTLNGMLAKGESKTPLYSELKRRLGWEYNGMRLHELYFGNLGGSGKIETNSSLYQKIVKDFGSYENWKTDFVNTGLSRGIGWVVLYQDPINSNLINTWINEHDVGHLSGATPLLIMDVWEHSFIPDYQLERAKYIDAFFSNINWSVVEKRFDEPKK